MLFSDLIIHRRDEKVDEVLLQCTDPHSHAETWLRCEEPCHDPGPSREAPTKKLSDIHTPEEIFHPTTPSLHVHAQHIDAIIIGTIQKCLFY